MATNVAKLISVDDLLFADNVRSPECTAIPDMVESYRRNGFKVNHPLVVSEKSEGKYLVLCGNRRGLGLQWLEANDKPAYHAALPTGKVPAIVHKGLTEEEETLLRIDHSKDEDRVPLDEWSVYLAVKQLAKVGVDTQERIAEKLGIFYTKGKKKGQPNRSYVQPRLNLARLPDKVEKAIRQYTIDRDNTAIRWSHLASLYKAYNTEFVEYPDGNGPLFTAEWNKAITPPTATVDEPTNGKKELTPADAVKRAQVASSQGLQQALLCLTGQSETSITDIDRAMAEGETAVLTVKLIADYLGTEDYAILIDCARAHAMELASPSDADKVEEPDMEKVAN
ncbi:MAG: hypothetical protein V3V68_04950 [Nitrosomonadaceae bacterium]